MGNFDFESTLIEMNEIKNFIDGKWVVNQTINTKLISQIMNNSYTSKMLNSQNLMNIYTILAHEVTHFLDYTTTIWGLEYFNRKKLCQYNNTHKSSEVLNINESELRIHESLVIKDKQSAKKLIDYELRHMASRSAWAWTSCSSSRRWKSASTACVVSRAGPW